MKVAVVGASGLVGRRVIKQLKEENAEIFGFASKKSNGQIIDGVKIKALNRLSIKKYDYAIFSAGSEVSKKYAKIFAKKGAIVIDNSNAFRRENSVPLVVPEINLDSVLKGDKIVANPNCSTIQIALPLFYINQICKIKRVIVSTYQSASGGGKKGLDDLDNKTTNKFPHILFDDLIPQIDIPLENGYTLEEDKIMFETKKILSLPDLKISATAVRVPIHYCHGASVFVEFEEDFNIEEIKKHLSSSKGIKLADDLESGVYPLAKMAKDTSLVFVGRIRRDLSVENGLSFWTVADNTMKGASSNAVQILKGLEERKWKLELLAMATLAKQLKNLQKKTKILKL